MGQESRLRMRREVEVCRWVSFGSLLILLFISSCGGEARVDVVRGEPKTPEVTGVVALPGGELAQVGKWWQRLAAAVSSPASALSGNATPAAGVAVQLVWMDNADALGPYAPQVLAETETTSTGTYKIKVPEGYDAQTCRLVVQVGTEEAGTLTRAFVYSTDEPIDIDYRSEATVRLILAEIPPARLCEFDTEEIGEIYDSVAGVPGEVSGGTAEEINAAATTAAASDPVVQGTIAAAVVPPTPTQTATQRPTTVAATRTATATQLPDTPTSTASPTSTAPATLTGSPTRTATSMPPITTRTPTHTVSLTSTPTATVPAARVLGTRIFSIADKPKSALFSSTGEPSGADISEGGFSSGPIKLVGGEVSATGLASIALQEDVVFGLLLGTRPLVLGTRPAGVMLGTRPALCVKLFAAGSSGIIACDGGVTQDVALGVNSNGQDAADQPLLTTRGGTDGGNGAASLTVTTSVVNATVTSAADCQSVTFDAGRPAAYTTTTATATIDNGCRDSSCTSVGQISLPKPGVNFSCAQWSTENSAGTLVSPLVAVDVPDSPDAAVILQLGD